MTAPVEIDFIAEDPSAVAEAEGAVVVLAAGTRLLPAAQAADKALDGALSRLVASKRWKAEAGGSATIPFPPGMKAEALTLVSIGESTDAHAARKAGGAAARALGGRRGAVFAGGMGDAELTAELAFGLALRGYDFDVYKTASGDEDEDDAPEGVAMACDAPEQTAKASRPRAALAEGVFFARDLVNEPANVLTTEDFAARIAAMAELGLEVEILDEPELERLGMRALLAVGQGSASPSKVAVMRWPGGGDEAPLALVGKGVVFDTGGISIKPAAGMEEMTMDMGGAAVVAGVMRALALRGAKANVVGLVGLVENMPDGKAQRPGDIVRSMKGDTIEVINTDAEGRLVLADVMWYAQQRFRPAAMIDLATLTGAMIVALGHETAGYFSNDDALAGALEAAARAEGEAIWRLPLGPAYDKLIKSRLADMKNTGGRAAGAITAAQFLQRFVQKGTPWAHIDIAGVALSKEARDLHPRGASGWGVMTLDRLVRAREKG
ncbi:leucyl aminopeptidase [Oceanicella actignis]|uniref:Probable cytosol aminopeptidase n=1 Tax=Oceanicella actignis TaxID=1189325 RepID=A0A1M7RYN5_9RHOB|nr:leucyl aminopeptidase [Oceanicella actignis]SES96898.1 leucyl aminopeptidase [Oceanicella actignis]SHN51321.1 leucyl aminopeptidase [Oceanicella actignis]